MSESRDALDGFLSRGFIKLLLHYNMPDRTVDDEARPSKRQRQVPTESESDLAGMFIRASRAAIVKSGFMILSRTEQRLSPLAAAIDESNPTSRLASIPQLQTDLQHEIQMATAPLRAEVCIKYANSIGGLDSQG